MAELPMVGARVPQEWQQQISAIAAASGRKEAEVVREALAQYLGRIDPSSIKGEIADLQDRVSFLEQKLAGLERLVRNENFGKTEGSSVKGAKARSSG